jgi:hypothetical protein
MKKLPRLLSVTISYYLLQFVTARSAFAQDIVGPITAPNTIVRDISQTGSFISAIIRFITVIAGVWALWQFLTGGFAYISSSGDKAKVQQGMQQIMMAITGLAIIGASFIIAAVVGRILFGPSFNILSPTLQSVQ